VSGTLRNPAERLARAARALHERVLERVDDQRGQDRFGIRASREKIDLSYANQHAERIPMSNPSRSPSPSSWPRGRAGAAGPELKSEEQKTHLRLGLVISQNLASFNLNASDLDRC